MLLVSEGWWTNWQTQKNNLKLILKKQENAVLNASVVPMRKAAAVTAAAVAAAVDATNHNHRPCRWYALAPLGHALG